MAKSLPLSYLQLYKPIIEVFRLKSQMGFFLAKMDLEPLGADMDYAIRY